MFSSALQINGATGSGMMVGGQFNQSDSVVAGNQVNVGYIGTGVYNFNSGYFTVSQLWLGGGDNLGVFNQNGGTNGFGVTHLDGGTYVLSNGYYSATISFDNFGEFLQQGGVLASDLNLFHGTYVLAGGVHQGSVTVPSPNSFTGGSAGMLQSGGTNYGPLNIGSFGTGSYTLSNGVSYADSVSLGDAGSYNQSGGTQTIAGTISVAEDQVNFEAFQGGSINLDGGQISSSGIVLKGFYTQTGGTNLTAGDVIIDGIANTTLSVSGGLLAAQNLTANPGFVGGVDVTGGMLIISNTLSVGGMSSFPLWYGFSGGGQLVVSNISLAPQAIFACRDAVIKQSGIFTMTDASLYSGSNCVQLGPLGVANGGNTNSTLYLVSPTSIMTFANSSGIAWSNEPQLIVEDWSGSFFGGGTQRIVFGNNSNGLTSNQLAHIQFHNPAGFLHERVVCGAHSGQWRDCARDRRPLAGEHAAAIATGRHAGDVAGRSRPHLQHRDFDRPGALGAVDEPVECLRNHDRDGHRRDESPRAVLSRSVDAVNGAERLEGRGEKAEGEINSPSAPLR